MASAELRALLQRKAQLETDLVNIERQIYVLEERYLQDTASMGNAMRGWDGYLSSRSIDQFKSTRKIREDDRLFTLSSTTGLANQDEPEFGS